MSRLQKSYCLLVFWSVTGLVQLILALDLSDVTSSIGLESARGTVAALADFNGDRLTDLFLLNATGILNSMLNSIVMLMSIVSECVSVSVRACA